MGSGTASQSRSQGRAYSAPRAGSPCGPCSCGAGAAPRPPAARGRGYPRRLRPRRGGGWLVLGSGVLGGDEVVGVDVVEVGVVVVVVVGVMRRHLLDAGGDAPHRLHVRLPGRPAPPPLPSLRHLPAAPVPRPVCPRGPTAPLPLPLGPFPAPTPLSPCPRRGSRPLLPAPWPAPPAPVFFPCPCSCPWLRPRSPTVPRSTPSAPWPPGLGRCSRPCVSFSCPSPFPAPCSRRAVRCPCPVPLRCRWPWRLAHTFALAPCRVRPGLPPALSLWHSPCRLPSPAPRSRGRHPAPPARCPPPLRECAGRSVAAVAAAA